MSTTICGWVEVQRWPPRPGFPTTWLPHIKIDYFVPYNQVIVDLVLDFGGYLGAPPVAANRGLPPDISFEAHQDGEAGLSPTWIGWDELCALPALVPASGEYVYAYSHDGEHDPAIPTWAYRLTDQPPPTPGVREWTDPAPRRHTVYRIEPVKPWRSLIGAWNDLFHMMALLAERYGAANVRLVVWADN